MRDLKKVFLTAGAVAAVGVTASVGTFAGFTDQKSIAGNSFSAGKVEVTLDGYNTTESVIELADMVFGDTTLGHINVANTGSNRSSYTLDLVGTGALAGTSALNEFSDQLKISVVDDQGTVPTNDDEPIVARQSVEAAIAAGAVSLGDFLNKNTNRNYRVTVDLESTNDEVKDNALALKSGAIELVVKATQRDGVARTNNDGAGATN